MKSKGLRIFGKILLASLIILLAIYYIIAPGVMAYMATKSAKVKLGDAPAGFEKITFLTEDGVKLSAWYKSPQNGKVIIVVHGAGGNKDGMKKYEEFLEKDGFGVLGIDLRGHGESEGKTNKFGWQGTKDIGAAVKYLKDQGNVSFIGGLGTSLGGEVLLGAASTYPEIKAIVTDGATCRSFQEFMDVKFTSSFIQATSYSRPMFSFVKILTGEAPPKPLLSSIEASVKTKYLFIAAGNVTLEPIYNQAYKEASKGRSEIWVAKGVGHTGAFGKYEQEYKQKVLDFFNKN